VTDPLRLTELEPHWYALQENGPVVGISFLCPHCQTQRLGVLFHHSGREAMEDAYLTPRNPEGRPVWTMTGDDGGSFEKVTLAPSVDASHLGHWHGFVRNGLVT
jgi:hypothetical protein